MIIPKCQWNRQTLKLQWCYWFAATYNYLSVEGQLTKALLVTFHAFLMIYLLFTLVIGATVIDFFTFFSKSLLLPQHIHSSIHDSFSFIVPFDVFKIVNTKNWICVAKYIWKSMCLYIGQIILFLIHYVTKKLSLQKTQGRQKFCNPM